MVLCSVRDVAASLREARRVLRPGGKLLLIEHVAAPAGSPLRAMQVRGGCSRGGVFIHARPVSHARRRGAGRA